MIYFFATDREQQLRQNGEREEKTYAEQCVPKGTVLFDTQQKVYPG